MTDLPSDPRTARRPVGVRELPGAVADLPGDRGTGDRDVRPVHGGRRARRPRRPPLLLLSHGTGSAPDVYRGLATELARSGFAVATIDHAENRLGDVVLAGTAETLRRTTEVALAAVDPPAG